jgi:hypothetical protein
VGGLNRVNYAVLQADFYGSCKRSGDSGRQKKRNIEQGISGGARNRPSAVTKRADAAGLSEKETVEIGKLEVALWPERRELDAKR